jgi:cyanophycinase-like exopeptidase
MVIPHFDMIHRWVPDAVVLFMTHLEPADVLVGIDEQTAMVDRGAGWQVWGRGAVHLLSGAKRTFHHDEQVPVPRVLSEHH